MGYTGAVRVHPSSIAMPAKLPVVCVFGVRDIRLYSSAQCPPFETRDLDTRCYETEARLAEVLAQDRPDVIVTIGPLRSFPRLHHAQPEVRRRWIHFDAADDLERIGRSAFHCYVDNCTRPRSDLPPLVSVVTCTYRTGDRIERPYASLKAQTYDNWQWVLVDDSDDTRTFSALGVLASKDHRLGVFRHREHSGVIGRVKRWGFQLAEGEILVELDHDDELTPNALADVVRAFRHFDGSAAERPLAGFVSTDFAEVYPDGSPMTYPENWGLGYGSYRWEARGQRMLAVANTPHVNPKTIRHIVGVPNHLRAWHRDCYQAVGGHSPRVHVADDYELIVRTFLRARMAHVPKLGYVQWRNRPAEGGEGNTHQDRNQEIQRLTRAFSQAYDRRIHERLLELGVDDFVWRDGEDTFQRMRNVPDPPVESHCSLLLPE